jgi:uroporphyrinogen decarboxylase
LPVYDLGVDAAILFSDILVIPYAMGMGLDFTDEGPVFEHPLGISQQSAGRLKSRSFKTELHLRCGG